jgi:hypothetical protein
LDLQRREELGGRLVPRSRSDGGGLCNFAHSPTCWGLDGARPRE